MGDNTREARGPYQPQGDPVLYAKTAEHLFNYWLNEPSFTPTGQVWGTTVLQAQQKVEGSKGKKPFALFPAAGYGTEKLEKSADRYNRKQRGEKIPQRPRKRRGR